MTRDKARAIIGGQGKRYLSGMAKALQFQPWRNTPQDWARLEALKALGYKVTCEIPREQGHA